MPYFYQGVMANPNVSDPYVYLKTLFYTHTGVEKDQRDLYRKTGGQAYDIVYEHTHGAGKEKPQLERMEKAMTFLKQAIKSQQHHEMKVLQSMLEELKRLPSGEADDELVSLLQQATSTPDSIDYKMLIKAFNGLLTSIQEFKGRLNNLQSPDYKNELERNLMSGVDATIANYQDTRTKFYYSQEELIRQLIQRFFTNSPQGKRFLQNLVGEDGAKTFAAMSVYLQQVLAKYIIDNGLLQYQKNSQKLSDNDTYSFNEFVNKLDELDSQLQDFYLRAESVLTDDAIIKDATELYGIKFNETAARRRGSKSAQYKAAREKIKKLETVVSNPVKNGMIPKSAAELIPYIKVDFGGDIKISYHKEIETRFIKLFNQFFSAGIHTGSLNTPTDWIWTLLVGMKAPPQGHDVGTKKLLEELKREIKGAGGSKIAATDMARIYLDKLTQLEKTVDKMQHMFIFHETTKYYTSIERGERRAYKGRRMNIFNYINDIATFGYGLGINVGWLKFAAYNMLDGAVGDKNRDHLLELLATFAGILIFDDFTIIAQEALETLEFNNITNVHLYNLNSVYVPASFFLQATYDAFYQQATELTDGMGFTLSLVNPIPNVTWKPSPGHPTQEDWQNWRDKASKVTVTMAFAASFLDFTSKLLA